MQLYISREPMERLKSSVRRVCITEMRHQRDRMQQAIMSQAGALRAGHLPLRKQ